MSRSQWRNSDGRLDILRVLVDSLAEYRPDCRVIAGLDPSVSFQGLSKRPLIVVDDILPGDSPVTAWGSKSLLMTQGFDVDVFAETRVRAVDVAYGICGICDLLVKDDVSGIVKARIGGSPYSRPWNDGKPGEKFYHRRGFELFLTFHS